MTAKSVIACALCAGPPVPGHNFCEACGRYLRDSTWRSSTAPEGPCRSCGVAEWGPEGYCERCGRRRSVGQDHLELALAGVWAVTDKGRHKQRNEDAVAIGRAGDLVAAVISDGVSSSARADEAAHVSVDAAMAGLLATLEEGGPPPAATVAAARAAAAAVAALAGPDTSHAPPSCTYVSAVVSGTDVVIGWVGDSRAYWLAEPPDRSRRLTTDDSLAEQLAAAGLPDTGAPDQQLGALARWLGADAGDTEPRVATFRPTGPGRVLLCSDGLSRYLGEPAELAVTAPGVPAETARALNQLSLDRGGVDNIAIVIIPFPPEVASP
jgi:serine/threonine protein phosphatase PrpC